MNDWIPIGVIKMTLPEAGVGVEIVRRLTALGDEGELHAAVRSAAVTTPTENRIPIVGMDLIITQR
jgi:hypothetical protein